MTEFEEIALKKIVKEYLIDQVYYRINLVAGRWGISDAEISKHIGWDPAGYNQKYSRSNDIRITTFIKIFSALQRIIMSKVKDENASETDIIGLEDFITKNEIDIGHLFNHISASVDGREEFLNTDERRRAFLKMRSFVLQGHRNNKFNDREVTVYTKFYSMLKPDT